MDKSRHDFIKRITTDDGVIYLRDVQFFQGSADLRDNAIAYHCYTEGHLRTRIPTFKPDRKIPEFCLRYLLQSIEEDLADDPDEFTHSRFDACSELGVPLAPYWQRHGAAMCEEDFFTKLENFLTEQFVANHDAKIYKEVVYGFLEGWPLKDHPDRLEGWRRHPVLAIYMAELDDILGVDQI